MSSMHRTFAMFYHPVTPQLSSHIGYIQLVVLHALQMGWSESPSFFCTVTETVRDITKIYMNLKNILPEHCLEQNFPNETKYTITLHISSSKINTIDVQVDDFIATTNDNAQKASSTYPD